MARITVEDCLEKVGDDNRFRLVHLAVERIKQRRNGAPALLHGRKNKEVVMALREVAGGLVTFENIRDLADHIENTNQKTGRGEAEQASE